MMNFCSLGFVCAVLSLPLGGDVVQAAVGLQGRWRLLEFSCVDVKGDRQVLAPGFPGSKEEWILRFQDPGERGNFAYSAVYVGLLGENCSLNYEGSFEVDLAAQVRAGKEEPQLSAIRLTPQRSSIDEAGRFPVPCQLFSTQRSQKMEARFERNPLAGGRNLRLRGTNFLKRCPGKNDSTEFLFEAF